ncbi:DUF6624 domain-containing protein [Streptomyces sp. NPDC001404]|uniref:DUF6624 domain-containing protein n=1 Tax=Streptomyces sp. NPDC001404 TaxID=3364571 RepID=UPI0036C66FC8
MSTPVAARDRVGEAATAGRTAGNPGSQHTRELCETNRASMAQEPQPSRPDIARELIGRAEQSAGQPWPPLPSESSPLSAQGLMEQANTDYLRRIVDDHGWPGNGLVGKDGAQAAATLALRVSDHELQCQLLSLLGRAVLAGEASRRQWAHMYDRCCVRDGTYPQRYGTQYRIVPGGDIEAYPIEDPPTLDERRAEVGLPPYATSAQAIRHRYRNRIRAVGSWPPTAAGPTPRGEPT